MKLEVLFEYNHSMNMQLIQLLDEHLEHISDKSFQLLSYILYAHQIKNATIRLEPSFQVWQIHNWDAIATINSANYAAMLSILKNDDLNREIEYANSAGQMYRNRIEDILFHIINHTTYHCAQTAIEYRAQGIPPQSTGYIMHRLL